MTFTTDMRLTIEIFDLMKSRGGKMTVYKDLGLIHLPKMKEEDEQEYDLTSQMQDYPWKEGWNFAECEALEDPIPMIVTSGYTAGAGMIHCWLEKPHEHCIPMEARVEDFHFAGYMPMSALLAANTTPPPPEDTTIHMGFKKLYLYKVDKELGIKGLLERKVDTEEQRKLFAQTLAAFGNHPPGALLNDLRSLQQQQSMALQQAAGLSASMLGTGIASSLGGILSGYGKQDPFDLNHFHYDPYGPSAVKHFDRVLGWFKRIFSKTSGTD